MKIKTYTYFSWTAVFVAAIAGLGLNFLFNLLSLAIGVSIFSKQTETVISFSLLSAIFFIVFVMLTMFTTGWIAGKLSLFANISKKWGILYGFVAWCLSFIMTVMLLMNMIQFTQFHSNFTSRNLTSIKISNQLPMMTESANANAETDKKNISLNAYVTFIFFMLGACSSAVGGYIGFQPKTIVREKL